MKNKPKKWALVAFLSALFVFAPIAGIEAVQNAIPMVAAEEAVAEETAVQNGVAKVGNTEYATIDEAIENWTNGTTLTLLADVTLTDVIKLSSTEYHVLDLGTYTMTAAKGKDAIQYVVNGRSTLDYALDIKADATNPGGITATGKAIVSHIKPKSNAPDKDRPITRFYGGVFNASYVVKQGGTGLFLPGAGYTGSVAPAFYFYGGVYNGTIYTNRSINQFYGGTFNGSMSMSVDSSAYTLIAGGTFKNLSNSMGSTLNSGKFTIGSAKGVYDKEVYVDENGNYVIAAAEPTEGIEAGVAKTPGTNDYLAYSKVAAEGQLKYTDAVVALKNNNSTSAKVTIYADEVDLTGVNYKGTIAVPEGKTLTIITEAGATPAWSLENAGSVEYKDENGNTLVKGENGAFVEKVAEVANYDELVAALAEGGKIQLTADIAVEKAVTVLDGTAIDLNGKTLNINVENSSYGNATIKNGNIVLGKDDVHVCDGYFLVKEGKTLVVESVNVSSSQEGIKGYAVFHLKTGANLDLTNSELNIHDNEYAAGYIVYAGESTATVDVVDTTVTASKVNGIVHAATVIENSTFTITNATEHGINRSGVTITDSTVAISGGTGRGITAQHGPLVVNGNSTINIKDMGEATIELRNDQDLTIADTATVQLDAAVNNTTSGTITGTVFVPVVQIGENYYATLAEAVAAAKAGDEIVLLADVAEDVTVPAGVIFNGNGKQVGVITAAGEITFKGYTKAANFGTKYTNTTINIGEGACLETTSGRLVIGHGCTFNITGTIADAKTAEKANVQPSLIMPGASFTGAGVTFNVTNAYVKFNNNSTSKNSNANGTFNFNVTNSIWDQTGVLAFYVPTSGMDPTFNLTLKDSVLTTTSHLVFSVTKGEIVIDNSNVNVGKSNQIENRSTMTIKNGSVVNGLVATSSNAINSGTVIVEDATYAVTGQFSGAAVGTGTLVIKKGATVSVGSIVDKANVVIDATDMTADDEVNFTGNLSKFTGEIEVVNNDKLEGKIVDGKIVLAVKPVASIGDNTYTTVAEAIAAAQNGDTITLFAGEFAPINISNKNITIQGTVAADGELLTTIKGGNPAITAYGFNGTIKDLKIVDAFKVMYAEPAGNVTVDNIYVTGATYGLHLVAYTTGLTWTIQNSYMDLAWANSFGVYGGGDAAIVIKGNEFVSTNPYYPNYGALPVNTFLPNVTVEGNVFGENTKINIAASITDTSKINISKNYHADGVNNAFVEDSGVKTPILEYYADKDMTQLVKRYVQIGENYYETLAEAVEAAQAGDEIVLLADIDYGTDQLKIEKAITLDLGGNTLTTRNAYGGISVKNNPTIKNGTIVHASNTAAIKVWNAVAFEDLVIDVQGKGDANKTIGGIVLQSGSTTRVGSIKNVTIKGVALTNGIETYNCGDATENVIGSMENVTINANGTGMLISAPCGTATNCTIKGKVNGIEIWIKGNYSASLTLENSEVDSVYAHDEFSSNPDIVNNGTLDLTVDEATTIDNVIVTLARVEEDKIGGVILEVVENAQAKVGDTYYATVAEAMAAAKAGDTVTIFAGTYAMPTMKAGITVVGEGEVVLEGTLTGTLENLTLKNLHIKGGNAQRWAYAKGDLVFENVTFEATGVYALHFDGITAGATLTYKDCTIIGWAAMSGSPASCTFEGCTFKGNGSYGVIRTYFDATITNCTFDVANVNKNDAYQDGIHAVEGAEVTVTGCTNKNGSMADLVNVHANSVVVVDGVKIQNVAKIGDSYYTTVTDAINAAKAGDTVTIFAGTYAVPTMKAGIKVVGEGEVVLEGTLTGTLENLTLKNLHIKGGNAQRWAYAKGDLVFENVTFEATGVYALHFDGITAGATLTYKNCTIIGWAAMSGSPASCVFNGCTFKGNGTYGLIRTYFDATIENCTFDVANVNTTDNYQDGIHAVEGATVTVNNCTNANGSMADIVNVHATSVVVVDGVKIQNVAKIGDSYYATLAAAIEAADGDVVIELLADVTLTETLDITKPVTLGLNGYTITSTDKCAVEVSGGNKDLAVVIENGSIVASAIEGSSALSVYDGADVTLNNVALSGGYYGIKLAGYHSYPSDVNNNNLTSVKLKGGSVTAKNAAIIGLGAYPNTQIDIDGTTVTSTDSIAIYHPSYGTLNITDGTITGTTAIYMKAGNLNISGGKFVANGEKADYEYENSGANATGDAIVIESCNYGGYPTPAASITGGTFTSANNQAVAAYKSADADAVIGFVKGGTFNTPVAEALCAVGYAPKANEDGTYGVRVKEETKFAAANLTIGVDLSVNFYVTGEPEVGDAVMNFAIPSLKGNVLTSSSEATEVTINGQTMWKFTFKGVGPHLMGKQLTATLVVEGITTEYKYSIQEYAMKELSRTAEDLGYTAEQFRVYREFLVNLLNYGAESQKYMDQEDDSFTISEEELVTYYLTEEQKAYMTHYHAKAPYEFANQKPQGVEVGKIVRLGTRNKIEILFRDATNAENNATKFDGWFVRVYGNGYLSTDIELKQSDKYADCYSIMIEDILVTYYDNNYEIFIYNAAGEQVGIIEYSIQEYVYNTQDTTKPAAALVKALWNYYHAAEDYIDEF